MKLTKIPYHIAYIIDGNGRWAKRRGLTRSMGHKAGFDNLKTMIKESFRLGIKVVSIYCFSTENWNRPKEEVDYLMTLFEEMVSADGYLEEMDEFKDRVKVNFLGERDKFNKKIQKGMADTCEKTKDIDEFTLNLAINYGGRDEIIKAVNDIISDGKKSIKKQDFANYLFTAGVPDPDYIIRTSGEIRISNFMLWQCAYSEFYFPKVFWPSFGRRQLIRALKIYSKRNRRYGAIKKENK